MRSRSAGKILRLSTTALLGLFLLVADAASGSTPVEDGARAASEQVDSKVSRHARAEAQAAFSGASRLNVNYTPAGFPHLSVFPSVMSGHDAESGFVDQDGNHLELTLDPTLQEQAAEILRRNAVPWGALVAIEPKTGKVLALAGHSSREPSSKNVALRGGFPAASLFKLITASAAVERSGMEGDDLVRFRGSNYSLGRDNFMPSPKRDSRQMSLSEAMGKSCNPVFARVALNKLSERGLAQYAANYGFNSRLPFEAPVEPSRFVLPEDDYSFARTAAGFGDVHLTPLHAAVITGTIANGGEMMRPFIVARVVDPSGAVRYQAKPSLLKRAILPTTAHELMEMMMSTVETGTARKQFSQIRRRLPHFDIAAKTGTLSGQDPKGLYTWFVAAAPAENPQIALAALVIDPGTARIRGSSLGRQFMEQYLLARGLVGPGELKPAPQLQRRRAPALRMAKSKRSKSAAKAAARRSQRASVQFAKYKRRAPAANDPS